MTVWRRSSASVLALGVLFCASAGGCAQTFDATTLGVPVTLASAAETPAEGSHFRLTSHAVYGLWGLAKLKQPSLRKALAAQLAGGAESPI